MGAKFNLDTTVRLTEMVKGGMCPRDAAKTLGISQDAVRAAAKRRGLKWKHIVKRPTLEDGSPLCDGPRMNHEGYIALVLAERPTGFLGPWSQAPGGWLYGRAA